MIPKAGLALRGSGILEVLHRGVADDGPGQQVGPQVGQVHGQSLVHRLVDLAHILVGAGDPAGAPPRSARSELRAMLMDKRAELTVVVLQRSVV